MITIFNRKELITTNSMKKQSEVRNLLAAHRIDYTVKTIDRTNPSPFSSGSRGRMGTMGMNMDYAYQYIIYVKKQDYEKALHIAR